MTDKNFSKFLLINGQNEVPLKIRRNPLARRILLHVGKYDGLVEIVLPPGATENDGISFANMQTDWVSKQLSQVRTGIPFVDGATVPLLGQDVTIRRMQNCSALPLLKGAELIVGGGADTLSGRVRRWLQDRALKETKPRVFALANKIHCIPGRITLRDTKSRWGSCSRSGNLNFSWRIVMAPEPVLNYVVAHEVAHLKEHNHSKAFWVLVEKLCIEPGKAKTWLRTNGTNLHCYGRAEKPILLKHDVL